MTSIQTFLTLGALILLTLAGLNANKMVSQSDIALSQNRYRLEALSLLTSYIEQSGQFFFDETSSDTAAEKTLENFTPVHSMGMDDDDNGIIDDFDDFHNYSKLDTGRSGVIFNTSFNVRYVQLQGDKIVPSGTKTYHKQMTIYIFDSYDPPMLYKYKNNIKVRDTLQVSFVHSYWFYN